MENETPSVNRVDDIRDRLGEFKGQRIKVKANMGRSRIVERAGTLVGAYPSLFIVEVEERRGRTARQSYQYIDILTGTVELYDTDSGEKIFDYAAAEEQQ
ncbi:Veg family protein [Paratractidigestivibacter sp.]|uniref:Veg family protein n=1 Tax=Paratractidigestivibacter sp. TaxID=2847316 RepID=UPI002AC931F0|nr:Veg family protein [Paratractidigestivibacter sp.]